MQYTPIMSASRCSVRQNGHDIIFVSIYLNMVSALTWAPSVFVVWLFSAILDCDEPNSVRCYDVIDHVTYDVTCCDSTAAAIGARAGNKKDRTGAAAEAKGCLPLSLLLIPRRLLLLISCYGDMSSCVSHACDTLLGCWNKRSQVDLYRLSERAVDERLNAARACGVCWRQVVFHKYYGSCLLCTTWLESIT